jgi:hypothetical protein
MKCLNIYSKHAVSDLIGLDDKDRYFSLYHHIQTGVGLTHPAVEDKAGGA